MKPSCDDGRPERQARPLATLCLHHSHTPQRGQIGQSDGSRKKNNEEYTCHSVTCKRLGTVTGRPGVMGQATWAPPSPCRHARARAWVRVRFCVCAVMGNPLARADGQVASMLLSLDWTIINYWIGLGWIVLNWTGMVRTAAQHTVPYRYCTACWGKHALFVAGTVQDCTVHAIAWQVHTFG